MFKSDRDSKLAKYLSLGFMPYIGWNHHNYNEDGTAKVPGKLPAYNPTKEQIAERDAKIKSDINLAFRLLKKAGK